MSRTGGILTFFDLPPPVTRALRQGQGSAQAGQVADAFPALRALWVRPENATP